MKSYAKVLIIFLFLIGNSCVAKYAQQIFNGTDNNIDVRIFFGGEIKKVKGFKWVYEYGIAPEDTKNIIGTAANCVTHIEVKFSDKAKWIRLNLEKRKAEDQRGKLSLDRCHDNKLTINYDKRNGFYVKDW